MSYIAIVFFVFCHYSSIIFAFDSLKEEPIFDKPYEFISLGEGCKVAGYIRGSFLSHYSYPFDWMLSTDFESIYQIFSQDFQDYMSFDHLKDLNFFDRKMNIFPDEPKNLSFRWVFETFYNIESRHDFDIQKNVNDAYAEVFQKINRRVQRFYQILHRTDITLFFVRINIMKEQAIRFRDLIELKFPNLKFVLVALNNTEDFNLDLRERRIRNFYFNDPVYQWDFELNNYRYNNGNCCAVWDNIVIELLKTL
jgi:tetrahydromethanopterin S-methyltransferase subunit G